MTRALNLLGWSTVLSVRAVGLASPAFGLRPRAGVSRLQAIVGSLTFAVVGLALDVPLLFGAVAALSSLLNALPSLGEAPSLIVVWSGILTALALARFVQWFVVLRWGLRVERERVSRLARFGVLYSFVLDAVTAAILLSSGWFWHVTSFTGSGL